MARLSLSNRQRRSPTYQRSSDRHTLSPDRAHLLERLLRHWEFDLWTCDP